MKFFVATFIYVNAMAATIVIAERACGPEPAVAATNWGTQRSCVLGVPVKGMLWPIYWLYRFWDRVL